MERILKVYELNSFIKNRLESDQDLTNITITGEISNITYNRSGHIYFNLKDDQSSISCIMWRSNADKMKKINGHDGMKINATGKINYYVPYGKVSFEVHGVAVEGIGELQIIYDKRFKELQEKGWFDQSLKKPLVRYPQNIGIVTADTGAAVHDLITTITRRWPIANIFLFPAQVQGEGSSETMAKAIVQANNFTPHIDTLVVGRGGGSYEDLWEFNEMPVLEAIRSSAIPVISAVGHEPDITLADYVADKRAATPTAAGEIATPSIDEIKQNMAHQYQSLQTGIINLYKNEVKELGNVNNSLLNSMNSISDYGTKTLIQDKSRLVELMNHIFNNNEALINNDFKMIQWNIDKLTTTSESNLNNAVKMLNVMNPERPLAQGYALLKINDKYISNNEEIKVSDDLEIIRKEQDIKATVKSVERKKK